MLFQLGGEVHGLADDRVFEPVAVAECREHDGAGCNRTIDVQPALDRAGRCLAQIRGFSHDDIECTHGVRCGCRRWIDRAEGRHNAIAEELVDDSAVLADHRQNASVELRQHLHHGLRRQRCRQAGEAANIQHENSGVAFGSFASLDLAIRPRNHFRHVA